MHIYTYLPDHICLSYGAHSRQIWSAYIPFPIYIGPCGACGPALVCAAPPSNAWLCFDCGHDSCSCSGGEPGDAGALGPAPDAAALLRSDGSPWEVNDISLPSLSRKGALFSRYEVFIQVMIQVEGHLCSAFRYRCQIRELHLDARCK